MDQNRENYALSDDDLENVAGGFEFTPDQRQTLLGLLEGEVAKGKSYQQIYDSIPGLVGRYGWMMPGVTTADLYQFLQDEWKAEWGNA